MTMAAQNDQLVKDIKFTLEGNINNVIAMDGMPETKKYRIIEGLKAQAEEAVVEAGNQMGTSGIEVSGVNRSTYPVYHQVDGGQRHIPVAQLKQHLTEVDPSTGRLVFDLDPPDLSRMPQMPAYKCFLNPGNPTHEKYGLSAYGLPSCRKANIPSEFARIKHMQDKHEQSWEMLRVMIPDLDKLTPGVIAVASTDEDEIERRVAERMEMLDEIVDAKVEARIAELLDNMGGGTTAIELPTIELPQATVSQSSTVMTPVLTEASTCSECGLEFAEDKNGKERTPAQVAASFKAHIGFAHKTPS